MRVNDIPSPWCTSEFNDSRCHFAASRLAKCATFKYFQRSCKFAENAGIACCLETREIVSRVNYVSHQTREHIIWPPIYYGFDAPKRSNAATQSRRQWKVPYTKFQISSKTITKCSARDEKPFFTYFYRRHNSLMCVRVCVDRNEHPVFLIMPLPFWRYGWPTLWLTLYRAS